VSARLRWLPARIGVQAGSAHSHPRILER
jgi:hypothetical protein